MERQDFISLLSPEGQALLAEMAVALRHADIRVSQQLLYVVDAAACINQKAGKAVAQVVHPKIGKTCVASYPVPSLVEMVVRLARPEIAKHINGPLTFKGHFLERRDCSDGINH